MKVLILALLFTISACSSTKNSKDSASDSSASSAAKVTKSTPPSSDSGKEMTKTASNSSSDNVSCVLKKDSREIASVPVDGGAGCEVKYTKWGETRVIGSASSDQDYCDKLVSKVKGNLEGAGFSCN